ncbi:MAG TPA: hypothetical protein VF203_11745 [Burkholderiales bacterium]
MEAFVDFWNGRGAWQRLPRPVRQSMLAGSGRLLLEWAVNLYDRSYLHLDDLPRVRPPVLHVSGERTIGPMKRLAGIVATRLRYCRAVTVPGAGHMAPFTHSAQVLPEIETHLAGDSGLAAEGGLAKAAAG